MTEHTKEPWRILPGKYPNVPQPIFSEDGQIASVGGYHEPGHAQRVANARRIVACVNACAGIPTEALESGALAELVVWAKEAAAPGVYVPHTLPKLREAIAKLGDLDSWAQVRAMKREG